MTQEIQNQIIAQFSGIVPMIAIALVVAGVLGIGYKILERKLINWAKKKREQLDKKSGDR